MLEISFLVSSLLQISKGTSMFFGSRSRQSAYARRGLMNLRDRFAILVYGGHATLDLRVEGDDAVLQGVVQLSTLPNSMPSPGSPS